MMARCSLCGRIIRLDEHYFITIKHTICKDCIGEYRKLKGKASEVCSISSPFVGSSKHDCKRSEEVVNGQNAS